MRRNEQYDEAILSIREMMQEEKYSEARDMCLKLLSGDLKYRCVNAEFWKLYANAEKERIVALPDIQKVGTADSVIAVYDQGCKFLKDPHEVLDLSLVRLCSGIEFRTCVPTWKTLLRKKKQ